MTEGAFHPPARSTLLRCPLDIRPRSLVTLVLLLLATSPLHAQVTAIRPGTLIDPATVPAARDRMILVEGAAR